MANITIDGVTKEYPNGLKYEEIASEYQKQYHNMIALVLENGKIRELIKPVHKDCTLFFDLIGCDRAQNLCPYRHYDTDQISV